MASHFRSRTRAPLLGYIYRYMTSLQLIVEDPEVLVAKIFLSVYVS